MACPKFPTVQKTAILYLLAHQTRSCAKCRRSNATSVLPSTGQLQLRLDATVTFEIGEVGPQAAADLGERISWLFFDGPLATLLPSDGLAPASPGTSSRG